MDKLTKVEKKLQKIAFPKKANLYIALNPKHRGYSEVLIDEDYENMKRRLKFGKELGDYPKKVYRI